MSNQKELIINLFNNKFNLERYINFTQEVFNGEVNYVKNLEFSPKVKGEFNSVVKSFLNLGKYTDKNRKTLILAVVELRKENSIARSRTIQRNFVKDYFLKGGVDSALVVFYNRESHDWRLSFIKLDYSYRNLKLEEDITPAKRFSFLLGENEKHHTAVERFMPLLLDSNKFITIEEIEEIFNIEVVTKEFFEKYCDLYLKIKKELDQQEGFKIVEQTADIKSEEFAKKLMGQLIFLYFLQKKGWLGVEVNPEKISKDGAESLLANKTYDCSEVFDKIYYYNDGMYIRNTNKIIELSNEEINCLNSIFINTEWDGKWGSGDKCFIRSMFKKANECGKNFFKDYLEPIFYNALNDKRGGNTYFKYLNCKIPFLNGGLFQPISEDYDYKNSNFTIHNELFSNKNKNKQGDIGDGVLDVFDRYAFTIKEDEPLEKEVAVDPEMLGKVFENLLDVKDRKKKGAFYTPREIVHYMCQESIINYLITQINLNYDESEALIRYGDIIKDIDSSNKVINGGIFKMPHNIREQAKKIDEALENVKIADPAVGSGAFPLGMVNEIVRARMNLTYYMMDDLDAVSRHNGNIKGRAPYDLKLKTIRRCIHAVDIERSAVDITKLRLWLSLVIEENDFRNIKALPNLDYNIMVGDSLVEEFEGVKLFNDNAILGQEDNKERDEKVEQLLLQIPENNKKNLLKMICDLEGRLQSATDIIESKKIEYELEEAKKSYNEIAASGVKRESEFILDEIYKLQEKFFEANNKDEKINLKKAIDSLEWILIEMTIKENGKEKLWPKINEFKRTNTKPYFLWKLNFARVFREKDGFDIVIGNPPYIDSEEMTKNLSETRKYCIKKYKSAKGNWDIFIIFIERGINLLRDNGTISYIVPNKLISADYSKELRGIMNKNKIIELRDYSTIQVFKDADVYPVVFSLQKTSNENSSVKMTVMKSIEDINYQNIISDSSFYKDIYWDRFFVDNFKSISILDKMLVGNKLGDICDVIGAATVGEAYEIKEYLMDSIKYLDDNFKKFINTGTIDRYLSLWGISKTKYIKGTYNNPIIKCDDLANISLKRLREANNEKIIIGGMTKRLECYLDCKGEFLAGKSTTVVMKKECELEYILAILNSKLMSFFYSVYYNSLSLKGGFFRIGPPQIKTLPIIVPSDYDINIVVDKSKELIKAILEDNNEMKSILDADLDKLIYKIYHLDEDEINIIEQNIL